MAAYENNGWREKQRQKRKCGSRGNGSADINQAASENVKSGWRWRNGGESGNRRMAAA